MIKEYLEDLGLSSEEIFCFLNIKATKKYKEKTLIQKVRDVYNYFKELGLNDKEIKKIITDFPPICSYIIEDVNIKKEILEKIGHSETEIIKMAKKSPQLFINCSTKTIIEVFNFLEEKGYTKEEIKKIAKRFPVIYCYSSETLKRRMEELEEVGYTKQEIFKMTKLFPKIYSQKRKTLDQKRKSLEILGYTDKELLKMTAACPTIYGFSIESMEEKIKKFIQLGYKRSDALNITKKTPTLFCLAIENIEKKFKDLESLGFTKEEVIEMTLTLPALFELSINNIREKTEYYNFIGLKEMVIKDARQLMQSLELSYARYEFLKEKGIVINLDNYRKLFEAQNPFEKKYHITKEELLKLYNYNEFKEKAKVKVK